MPTLRVRLFKDSYEPFLELLKREHIAFEEKMPPAGVAMAAGIVVELLYATSAVLTPVAAVLIAWIKSRGSRKVIVTRRDNLIIHLTEGMSVDEVKRILDTTKDMVVIDAKKDGQT